MRQVNGCRDAPSPEMKKKCLYRPENINIDPRNYSLGIVA